MDVEQVRQFVESEFPELKSDSLKRDGQLHGYSLFYHRIERGAYSTRIGRITQSSPTSDVLFKRVVTDRLNGEPGPTTNITGREDKLCDLIRGELALWDCWYGDE